MPASSRPEAFLSAMAILRMSVQLPAARMGTAAMKPLMVRQARVSSLTPKHSLQYPSRRALQPCQPPRAALAMAAYALRVRRPPSVMTQSWVMVVEGAR